MGDLFIKMVKANDFIGIGKLGLAMAGVQLTCNAAMAISNLAIEAMANARNPKEGQVRFLSHAEAKAGAKKN